MEPKTALLPFRHFDNTTNAFDFEIDLLEKLALNPAAGSIYCWTSSQALVIPERMQMLRSFNEAALASHNRGWPVVARKSGGGVCPQGDGIVALTMVFRGSVLHNQTISEAYQFLCLPIVKALQGRGNHVAVNAASGSFCDGKYNVTIDGKKCAGTALRCKSLPQGGLAILAHAVILVSADIAAACFAMSELYHDLGLPERFSSGLHINASDALKKSCLTSKEFCSTLEDCISELQPTL